MKVKILLLFFLSCLILLSAPSQAQDCNNDTVKPDAICNHEVNVPLYPDEESSIFGFSIDAGSYDDCSTTLDFRLSFEEDNYTLPPPTNSLSFNQSGDYDVVFWVIDEAGNWDYCVTLVHVMDVEAPNCNNDTIPPTSVCNASLTIEAGYTLTAEEVNEGSYDDCSGVLDFRINLAGETTEPPASTSLTLFTLGNHNVAIWTIDEAGNWSTCWAEVTVVNTGGTNNFSGFVFLDDNQNCQFDIDEDYLDNWTIELRPLNDGIGDDSSQGTLFTTTSDPTGFYSLPIPAAYFLLFDSLELKVNLAMNVDQSCALTYALPTSVFDDVSEVSKDFAVTLQEDCYALQVDIGAPFIRRCFEGYYTISYCNYGSVLAEDAFVVVELDNFLTYLSSDIPFSNVAGNTYTFQLGDIAPGDCSQFNIYFNVSCDAELGQTHCTQAIIFPNKPCDGNYLGAALEANGNCDEASEQIKFTITNIGDEDMTEAKNYLVVEDVIMYMTEPFQLPSGESLEIDLPANGATFRLEVEQPDNYPWLNVTSTTVEGCGQNENGETTLGLVNAFSQNEAGPFIAIDCQENIGSFDPNDKQAFPRGVGEAHLLKENTDIEYKIRFQNTGTDTAFTVVVLDTLSEWLDLSSVRPGASSHPYSFQVLEGNVLEFRFSNILLPDSTTNEAASNGFLQFYAKQIPDNPHGTIIKNKAAIYFDYNEPVITNTVFHTIGELFVMVETEETISDNLQLKVYPNPFNRQTTFELPEATEGTFLIYNMQGQVVHRANFSGNSWQLDSLDLPGAGLYTYEFKTKNSTTYRGKIVVRLQ